MAAVVEEETEVKTPENEPEKAKSPEPVVLESNSESDDEPENSPEKQELVK